MSLESKLNKKNKKELVELLKWIHAVCHFPARRATHWPIIPMTATQALETIDNKLDEVMSLDHENRTSDEVK